MESVEGVVSWSIKEKKGGVLPNGYRDISHQEACLERMIWVLETRHSARKKLKK